MLETPDVLILNSRLKKIEQLLKNLEQQRVTKEWYSIVEVAEIMGRRPWTCREWARLGRIDAVKRQSGRGPSGEWIVSHAELTRLQNEGLLPIRKDYPTYDR